MAAIAITHLGHEWQCQHRSPFDNVRFIISRRVLDEFADDSGRRPVGGLVSKPGQIDPLVWHLANAVMPALEQSMNVSLLFVDQMLLGPMRLVDMAIACGFADQSHLTRIFAAIYGISP
jgi:AraC family transcriptional regulator